MLWEYCRWDGSMIVAYTPWKSVYVLCWEGQEQFFNLYEALWKANLIDFTNSNLLTNWAEVKNNLSPKFLT